MMGHPGRRLLWTTVSLVLLSPVNHIINFLGATGLDPGLAFGGQWYLQVFGLLRDVTGLISFLQVHLQQLLTLCLIVEGQC